MLESSSKIFGIYTAECLSSEQPIAKIKAFQPTKDDNRFAGNAKKKNVTINNSTTHKHTELLILDCETRLIGASLTPMAHTVLTGSL